MMQTSPRGRKVMPFMWNSRRRQTSLTAEVRVVVSVDRGVMCSVLHLWLWRVLSVQCASLPWGSCGSCQKWPRRCRFEKIQIKFSFVPVSCSASQAHTVLHFLPGPPMLLLERKAWGPLLLLVWVSNHCSEITMTWTFYLLVPPFVFWYHFCCVCT